MRSHCHSSSYFFSCASASSVIYTLSLHDALPICLGGSGSGRTIAAVGRGKWQLFTHEVTRNRLARKDRKSTRLNSSHVAISYAVFCLKKKNIKELGYVLI